MGIDWKMEAYWRLPPRIQEAGLSLYARHLDHLYYGGEYQAEYQSILLRSWKTIEDVESWQLAKLRTILRTAMTHVRHYREAYRAVGASDVTSLRALRQLPLLDRQSVRQREVEFVDERLDPSKMFKAKTSGSTGTSLTIFWSIPALQRFQAAFEVRIREAAGVSRRAPRAMLGGRPIVRGGQKSPPFWRLNRYWGQLYLSSYHVSQKNAPGYVRAIRDAGVEWLTGYGSAIAALAESAAASGVEPTKMRCVVVSGDTLQSGMRRSIEEFFRCKCYDSYGQVEGVSMAMECAQRRLHLIPEVGIVEIVREDGADCAPGEVGEMVATGIVNDGMPLVRYRTGDYAAWAVDQQCGCGLPHPIIEALEGRVDDYLETTDGRRIGRLSTAMKRSPSIHSAQIVQDRPGHAFLFVRPGVGYMPQDALPVRDDLLERIGEFDFEIVEIPEIPKTPAGKTRLVVRLSERPDLTGVYGDLVARHRGRPS